MSNTSAALNSGTRYGIDTAIAPNGDIVAVTQLSVSGNYIFDMHVKSNVNGTWSRIFLDNTSNTGHNPSVEVDRKRRRPCNLYIADAQPTNCAMLTNAQRFMGLLTT